MSSLQKTTGVQPKQRWLRCLSSCLGARAGLAGTEGAAEPEQPFGCPAAAWSSTLSSCGQGPSCESRAAPQEAEEHRDSSSAASSAEAAAAESRAAAPHSPRGCGQALLHSLQRGCRALLSRVAAVIPRRRQGQGSEVGTAENEQEFFTKDDLDWMLFQLHEEYRKKQENQEPAGPFPLERRRTPIPSLCQLEEPGLRAVLGELGSEHHGNVIIIHTIWVNPRYPALWEKPGSLLAEEADADLPSTSPAPAAPRDTQPAAAAPARAPEDEDLRCSAEEESTSGSLILELLLEDTEVSGMAGEESAFVPLPREAWAESWDSHSCSPTEDGLDQPEETPIVPFDAETLSFSTGTGTASEEGSLSQVEEAGRGFTAPEAVLGPAQREDERLQGVRSAAAVPVQRPSPFRRALRALRRAFGSLRCLTPGLQA